MSNCPDDETVRRMLKAWMARNGWYIAQISRVMSLLAYGDPISITHLDAFAENRPFRNGTFHRRHVVAVHRFLTENPSPGPFDAFAHQISERALQRAKDRNDEIVARAIANERRHADRARYWLEQEGRPKKVEHGVLFGLDKATIAALSGGVRT